MMIDLADTLSPSCPMIRAVRISLSEATASKQRRLQSVLRELRSAANFYARSIWKEKGKLDAETHGRYKNGSLNYSQRNAALKFALDSVICAKSFGKQLNCRVRCPVFRNALRLSKLVCRIEQGKGCFDYVMKVTSMRLREPLVLPFKSHERLNYWLAKGGKILDGAIISSTMAAWIYVELPDEPAKTEGDIVGLDTGYKKLLTDSNGNFYGRDIGDIVQKIRRKKPGSIAKRKARVERQDYVNFVCRRLPWQTVKTFVLEDLTGMKVGKGNRGKRNRKLLAPWSYRQVRTRLEQLAPENRVRLEFVSPKFTSRICPSCGWESAKNRVGEKFCCLRCNYTADADFVGARNILAKFTTTGNCPERTVPVGDCGELLCGKKKEEPYAQNA